METHMKFLVAKNSGSKYLKAGPTNLSKTNTFEATGVILKTSVSVIHVQGMALLLHSCR